MHLRSQSGFSSWQTGFFSNGTLEHSFNPSRDQVKLTSEFSSEVGPFPFWTQQHGEVMLDSSPRSDRISTRGTTHRSPRRPCTDHDSTRLPHPLAGFCLWEWRHPTGWWSNDSTLPRRKYALRHRRLYRYH
jgi:hypothetical protein